MARISLDCIVAGLGQYDIDGNVYPYAELVDNQGGGVFRAMLARDYGTPPVSMSIGKAELELHAKDGQAKLRLHRFIVNGATPAVAAQEAATTEDATVPF